MGNIAYLDLIGGFSGDMFLAAMIDAGLDRELLSDELAKIVPQGFSIETQTATRGSICATHVSIRLAEHRPMGWEDFSAAIKSSELPTSDLGKIASIFNCLSTAEGKAHGAEAGTTHLHELGSLDTLVDIAGAVIGLRILGVDVLQASPIPASVGISESSHGRHASLAPATMEVIRSSNIPVRIGGSNPPAGESVTPTGAAILAVLAEFRQTTMSVEGIGYGAGTRNSDSPPNVVGLWLGSEAESDLFARTAKTVGVDRQRDIVLVETNVDDMTGEALGYAMEQLFDAGALDVWFTAVQMKKSRPGTQISALAREVDLKSVTAAYFASTSTLGVRVRGIDRLTAGRKIVKVSTGYGDVAVKMKRVSGEVVGFAPEYDECVEIATRLDVSLKSVMDEAIASAGTLLSEDSLDW